MFVRDEAFARRLFRRPLTRFALSSLFLFAITFALWVYLYRANSVAAAPRVSWPSVSLHPVTSGLSSPVAITHAGDGSNRIFVVEQTGKIKIYKNSTLLSMPFVDLGSTGANRISVGSERGLLSIAFPPNYSNKGWFYVYYTDLNGNLAVARYRVTANPDVADPNSEQMILNVPHPGQSNHNGGQLQFGRDGFLYLGTGDGGGGGDPSNNAQNPSVLLGKILRINVEPGYNPYPPPLLTFTPAFTLFLPYVAAAVNPPVTYTIPISNPYTTTVPFRSEIWAWGVRNPWRFTFDRQNGDMYIADVGQNLWEEVDFQASTDITGPNYGWRCYEGNHSYNTSGCGPIGNYVFPKTEYDHGGGRCSVTGGYVYRGSSYAPAMTGIYFFGDLCSKTIWGMQFDGSNWVTSTLTSAISSISTFGEDQAGELYVAGYGNGVIYKISSP